MGREKVVLICSECLSRNYQVTKRKDDPRRIEIKKYCPHCNRHTVHKESR